MYSNIPELGKTHDKDSKWKIKTFFKNPIQVIL